MRYIDISSCFILLIKITDDTEIERFLNAYNTFMLVYTGVFTQKVTVTLSHASPPSTLREELTGEY